MARKGLAMWLLLVNGKLGVPVSWSSSTVESVGEADCLIAFRFSSREQPLLRRPLPTVESVIERLISTSDDDTSVAVSLAVDMLEFPP